LPFGADILAFSACPATAQWRDSTGRIAGRLRLPNPDKQFVVMPGISHASFQQKNYLLVYHILHSFFSQPEPVYCGES